jgi:glycogen debranching enzyme
VPRTEHDRLADLTHAVQSLYAANRRQGHAAWCDRDYDYTCPAPETYPFQWFWDSCFHAIVLSRLDVERAEAELRTLLAGQHPDGFIGHITLWPLEEGANGLPHYFAAWRTPWTSSSMQPPVLAEAVEVVAARGASAGFLGEVLPAVRAYYDWCDRDRDPEGDGLLVAFEPHETGMDQSPSFDTALGVASRDADGFGQAWRALAGSRETAGDDPGRLIEQDRFVVVDLMINTAYAENQRALARLHERAGDEAGAAQMHARATRTSRALWERCWDPSDRELHALAGRERRRLPGGTIAGLLPLLLEDLPSGGVDAITERLADHRQFSAPYPVPSVSRSHPAYQPDPGDTALWRGPTWMVTNWYLARGLRRHGRPDLAVSIEDASLALVERSGFREHYNPETGAGLGARDFAWSALALEMLASRAEGSGKP